MSEQRRAEASFFYAVYRIADFYHVRRKEYERADSQLAAVTTTLLLLAAGVLGAGEVWLGRAVWGILAAASSALAATVSSWGTLIGFRENARLYRSSRLALDPLLGPLEDRPDDAEALRRVVVRAEEILQAETSQWGQHLKASAASLLPQEPRADVDGRVVTADHALMDFASEAPARAAAATPETPFAAPVGRPAQAIRVARQEDLPRALTALGLDEPRPVIVLVGGAAALADDASARLRPLFDEALLPVAARLGATLVDGGTRSGVMRALGESRARTGGGVTLVGVAVAGTVRLDGAIASVPDAADLDPHHTHFVLVAGTEWGEESPWLAKVARALAGPLPSVTVLVNGGDIAVDDAVYSTAAERPVVVVDGSGRAADDLAAAVNAPSPDRRLRDVAASGLVTVVPIDSPAELARALTTALGSQL